MIEPSQYYFNTLLSNVSQPIERIKVAFNISESSPISRQKIILCSATTPYCR